MRPPTRTQILTKMMKRIDRRHGLILIPICFLAAAMLISACAANQAVLRSGKETPGQANSESEKTPIEKELEAMQTAGFEFVYILRRKDGGKIDADDRKVIKAQTVNTNRRVATDDDRAVIVGSNNQIPAENLEALYLRFSIENYSPAPAINTAGNGNLTR